MPSHRRPRTPEVEIHHVLGVIVFNSLIGCCDSKNSVALSHTSPITIKLRNTNNSVLELRLRSHAPTLEMHTPAASNTTMGAATRVTDDQASASQNRSTWKGPIATKKANPILQIVMSHR